MGSVVYYAECWGGRYVETMDEPLPLAYMQRKTVGQEKHTESVTREERLESGGASANTSRRKIEVGKPIPLGYAESEVDENVREKPKGKSGRKEKIKIDIGDPIPLEVDHGNVSVESMNNTSVEVDDVVNGSERVEEVKKENIGVAPVKTKQQHAMKHNYDFGSPLPLEYLRRTNVTGQSDSADNEINKRSMRKQMESETIGNENEGESELEQSTTFDQEFQALERREGNTSGSSKAIIDGPTTSSPLEGTTLAESLNLNLDIELLPIHNTTMDITHIPTTEEVLYIAAQTHGDPVTEIQKRINEPTVGSQYRLVALRAHRVAERQTTVLGKALGVNSTAHVPQGRTIGILTPVSITTILLISLAVISFSLAD